MRLAALAVAMAVLGCLGDTAAPKSPRRVSLAMQPVFQSRAAASSVPFDRVRITLTRGTGVAFDTTIDFPPGADSVVLGLSIPISGASETLSLNLAMINAAGDTVFRAGPVPVTLTTENAQPTPLSVPVQYSGVGANARSVRIATRSVSLVFRDSVTLTATALDSVGEPISGTPIAWRSLDTLVARVRVDTLGRVVAGTTRGVARIEAMLPTGLADTAQVTVQPVPAVLSVVSGSGQSAGVGTVLAQPLVVRVKAADSLGVHGVAVNFSVASGGGSLSKATDTTAATGNAQTTWTLGSTLGSQSVTATVAGLPNLTVTLSATGVVGAPKKLAFQVQPSNAAANVAMVPAVQVVAQDTFGNTVTSFAGNVTLAIGTNPGGSTLGGTLTVAAVAGIATFSNLTLNQPGTGYTLAASATGLASATSAAFNVSGGVPTQLAIVQQPSNATAGAAITPAVTVQIRDANGNLVTTATNAVTVAIGTNPGGGSLSGTATVSAVAGVATFSSLSIDRVGSGYTLTASASGLAGATSVAFNIAAGAASQLAIATQPSATAQSGVALGQQPVLQLQDASGNAVSQSGVVVTATIATGGGTLGGTLTATTVANGTATFTNLAITGTIGARTLTFAATGLTSATSSTITVSAGAASQLAITTQPSAAAQSSVAFGQQPVIQLQDASGNEVRQSGVVVTASIATGGGTLGGTLTASTNTSGVATFTNLAITGTIGIRTLTFTATGLTSATSGNITVSAGAATQLAFTTQPPASDTALRTFGFTVTARDGGGNTATSFVGTVTVAIGTNPAGGTLSGTLTQTAASGVATFSSISIDNIGTGYTLSASATGLISGTSTAFNVVAPLNVNAWINTSGGSWNTAANWSKNAVPVSTDTVWIRQSGTYTVTDNVATSTVAGLDVGAPLGTQTLVLGGRTLLVTGNLTTSGLGVLSMTSATDSLGVGGSASFGGGSTTGLLTNGAIGIAGNFTQNGSATSFAPSGAHRTWLAGSSAQNISFANPLTSFFNRLEIPATGHRSVVLQTNAVVNDSLVVLGGAAPDTVKGAGSTQRLTVNGILRATLQTASPVVVPPVLELSVFPAIDGSPVLVSPDTLVLKGAITNLPTSSGFVYKSVRVNTTGTLNSQGGATFRNNLIVSAGTYAIGTGIDSVAGFLRTEATGALSMVASVGAPTVVVGDSAVFAGGPSTTLTGGILRIRGNFVQRGSPNSFAPSGTHRVTFARSSGVQTIQFADSVNSFFHDLVLNRPIVDTVRIGSNVQVTDSAIVSGSTMLTSTLFGALKLPASGVLDVHSGAVLKPWRVEFGTLYADSDFIGGPARILPDTAVFLNGGTIANGSVYGWRSVRVDSGSTYSYGNTYNGGLIISGTGSYALQSGQDSVAGFLRTQGSGHLSLGCGECGALLVVHDSAVFAGGTSNLTNGSTLRIRGSFVQRANPTALQADPGSTADFAGTSAQTINFTDPDSTAAGSQFGNLLISNASAGGVTLANDVFAMGQLRTADTLNTRTVFGSSYNLDVHGLSAGGCSLCSGSPKLILNNVSVVVDNGAPIGTFRDVTWVNMPDPTAVFLWVRRGGGLASNYGSISFPNLTFPSTPPNPGYYVRADQTDLVSPFMILHLTGTTPSQAANGGRTYTSGGAGLSWSP